MSSNSITEFKTTICQDSKGYTVVEKWLNSWLVTLWHFISKSRDKSLFFCQAPWKALKVEWNKDYEAAFQQLKNYMGSSPLLTKPKVRDTLQLYLATSKHAISPILSKQEDKKKFIQYTSKNLNDAEIKYYSIEKLSYVLATSTIPCDSAPWSTININLSEVRCIWKAHIIGNSVE